MKKFWFLTSIAACVNLMSLSAQADNLYSTDKFTLDYHGTIGAYFGKFNNNQFGTGEIVDQRTFEIGDKDTDTAEAFLKPGLTFNYTLNNGSSYYGGATAIATITRLDGDPGGGGQGDEDDLDMEEYYLGWRSEQSTSGGDSVLDFSIGAQTLEVGYDGFFIMDPYVDQFGDAAYWLAPRRAFRNSAILKYNQDSFSSQLFYLKAGDRFHENSELVGLNTGFKTGKYGDLGASYLTIIDSDDEFLTRDGMEVAAVRANLTPLPDTLPNFTIKSEYVKEFGDNQGTDIDADGWYTELAYTFTNHSWEPTFKYRYSDFSGDDDPENGDIETFDPLFYGFTVPGNWYQGEIAGSYLTFNSNQKTHMFYASIFPTSTVGLELIHYQFDLDADNFFGTPVDSKKLANETDFYVTFYPNDNLLWGLTISALKPDAAAEQVIGGDDTWYSFQVFAQYDF